MATRALLVERTERLERVSTAALAQCEVATNQLKAELLTMRDIVAERTQQLAQSGIDAQAMMGELDVTHGILIERTSRLEQCTGEFSRLQQTSLMGEGQLRANAAELALREKALTATISQLLLAHELLQVASRQLDSIRRSPFKFAFSSQLQVISKRFQKR